MDASAFSFQKTPPNQEHALETAQCLPQHKFKDAAKFAEYFKDYKCKVLPIPHKKPKKKELAQDQKAETRLLASERIAVEHNIAGLKRYRRLSDRLRIQDIDLYNVTLGVCAGL